MSSQPQMVRTRQRGDLPDADASGTVAGAEVGVVTDAPGTVVGAEVGEVTDAPGTVVGVEERGVETVE